MIHIPHQVQHAAQHLAREHDGPKGALGGAGLTATVLLSGAALISAPVSVPVIATTAAIGAIAGWFGAFKDH